MKKLIALLAVMGFVHSTHAADFSHSGEFRLQYQNDENYDGVDGARGQGWFQRFRLGTTFRAGEQLTGHIMAVHNAKWGQNYDQTPDGTLDPDGDASANNLLTINEAYGAWMINDEMLLRFGRGSMTVADGTVVSSNEYQPVWRAFDGVMFTYDHEMVRASAFGVVGAANVDYDNEMARFYGVSLDFKSLPDALNMANLHYITVKPDTFGTEDETYIGLTLAGATAGVDYRATYSMYDGDDKGNMMDVELGYSMPDVMGLRLSVLYHADEAEYEAFHQDIHNNAGFMDIADWSDLTYIKVGATVEPSDDLKVGLAYYMFEASDAGDDLGTEINLWATKSYSNNFSITGRYGIFDPEAAGVFGLTGDSKVTQVYLGATMSF